MCEQLLREIKAIMERNLNASNELIRVLGGTQQ